MNIMLVDAHVSEYAWNQDPAPPLGLLYLAAAIKNRMYGIELNHDVQVLPMQIYRSLPEEDEFEIFISAIKDYQPDIIGFGSPTPSMPNALSLAKIARERSPDSLIVFGGYQATVDTTAILENDFVDVAVRGEGEVPFCQLVSIAESKSWTKMAKVEGIAFKTEDNRIQVNMPQKRISEIDNLPFPDRSLVPIDTIKKMGSELRAGGIISSRGCPWNCEFCCSPKLWGNGFYRSARSVVDEIEILVNEYGLNKVRFEDDTFTTSRKRVFEICSEILKRGLKIEWEARTRIDLADEKMFVQMRKAGLVRLQVGVETINENSLKKIDKHVTFNKYEKFFEMIRKTDLGLIISVIIGIPCETPEQMTETLKWVREHITHKDRFIRCMYTPFPGIALEKEYNPVVLSNDFAKYTMDIPLVTSDLFTYSNLIDIKNVADELMCSYGPTHTVNSSMPVASTMN